MSYKTLFFLLFMTASMAFSGEGQGAEQSALRLSIVQKAYTGGIFLRSEGPSNHFTVLLENTSMSPIKIWGGLQHGGYKCLYFSLSTEAEGRKKIERSLYVGTETDMSDTLSPGDRRVIEVYPFSGDWVGFPSPTPDGAYYSVKVFYESKSDNGDALGWKGIAESVDYKIYLMK